MLRFTQEMSGDNGVLAVSNPSLGIKHRRRSKLDHLFGGALELNLECEREDDGRWLAEVVQLPGVLAYGASANEAMSKAEVLALRVLAEQLEHGEVEPIEINLLLPAAA